MIGSFGLFTASYPEDIQQLLSLISACKAEQKKCKQMHTHTLSLMLSRFPSVAFVSKRLDATQNMVRTSLPHLIKATRLYCSLFK